MGSNAWDGSPSIEKPDRSRNFLLSTKIVHALVIKYLIVIKFPKISPLYNFKLQEKETLALTRHFFSFLFGDDHQTFDEETSKKKGKKKEKNESW